MCGDQSKTHGVYKMFDVTKLHSILRDTTCQLRKGQRIETRKKPGLLITELYFMPHEDEPEANNLEKIDLEFVTIGVDRGKAIEYKDALIDILDSYPNDRLSGGPSYIEVGAEIGDQGAAFQLFALGKVLGLWDIITPRSFGFKGKEAKEIAGRGLIMITGYQH
jgi:hypothetical protein